AGPGRPVAASSCGAVRWAAAAAGHRPCPGERANPVAGRRTDWRPGQRRRYRDPGTVPAAARRRADDHHGHPLARRPRWCQVAGCAARRATRHGQRCVMVVILTWLRLELRRRWRSLAVLALLVAVSSGVVMTAVAAGRRGDTSLPRLSSQVEPT